MSETWKIPVLVAEQQMGHMVPIISPEPVTTVNPGCTNTAYAVFESTAGWRKYELSMNFVILSGITV